MYLVKLRDLNLVSQRFSKGPGTCAAENQISFLMVQDEADPFAKLLHAFDIAPLFINIGNCSGVIQFLYSVQTCFQIAEGF